MSDEEYRATRDLSHAAAAVEISQLRIGHVVDQKLRRRRSVSKEWVRQQREARQETPPGKKPSGSQKSGRPARNQLDMDKRGTECQTEAPEGGFFAKAHHWLDVSLAAYITATERMPSETSVLDLAAWLDEQRKAEVPNDG